MWLKVTNPTVKFTKEYSARLVMLDDNTPAIYGIVLGNMFINKTGKRLISNIVNSNLQELYVSGVGLEFEHFQLEPQGTDNNPDYTPEPALHTREEDEIIQPVEEEKTTEGIKIDMKKIIKECLKELKLEEAMEYVNSRNILLAREIQSELQNKCFEIIKESICIAASVGLDNVQITSYLYNLISMDQRKQLRAEYNIIQEGTQTIIIDWREPKKEKK